MLPRFLIILCLLTSCRFLLSPRNLLPLITATSLTTFPSIAMALCFLILPSIDIVESYSSMSRAFLLIQFMESLSLAIFLHYTFVHSAILFHATCSLAFSRALTFWFWQHPPYKNPPCLFLSGYIYMYIDYIHVYKPTITLILCVLYIHRNLPFLFLLACFVAFDIPVVFYFYQFCLGSPLASHHFKTFHVCIPQLCHTATCHLHISCI